MPYSAEQALERAVRMGAQSPCAKSKRGVAIWDPELFDILCANHNHPPRGFACDGSDACRENCGRLCVHAEVAAMLDAKSGLHRMHMLHVKVVDGEAAPSGPPSCIDCSKAILAAGIKVMWLLHEDGLKGYPTEEFHELSLKHHGLPVIR
jgi:deoxycytidylate deaminase